MTRRTFLGTAAVAAGVVAAPARAVEETRLEHGEGEKVSFLRGRQPLFDYCYGAGSPKPYVHPFCAPNGVPLTLLSPADHVHHRGLMLAWTNVNGFDFWGETDAGEKGRILHQRFEKVVSAPIAEITAINYWVGGGTAWLIERRTLRARPMAPDVVWLDWESELEPWRDPVTIRAEHEHPVPGRAEYNGLGVRFRTSMNSGKPLNALGARSGREANGQRAAWCAFDGPLEEGGSAGMAIFDHPRNLRHPTPFYVAAGKTFSYLSAAPTFRQAIHMKPGDRLRLRWAVLSFLGEANRRQLGDLYDQWSGTEQA